MKMSHEAKAGWAFFFLMCGVCFILGVNVGFYIR